MNAIKIINACLVGGEHQEAGTVLFVGSDLDKDDAERLVRMGRAVAFEALQEKPAEKKKREG